MSFDRGSEDSVIRAGWRTRKRQPGHRLMGQSSKQRGTQFSNEAGGRKCVWHILNPHANIGFGRGMQGSGQSMSPLGIENLDTEQPRNAERCLTVLVKYAQIGLKWSLARVNRDQHSPENSTASPPL